MGDGDKDGAAADSPGVGEGEAEPIAVAEVLVVRDGVTPQPAASDAATTPVTTRADPSSNLRRDMTGLAACPNG